MKNIKINMIPTHIAMCITFLSRIPIHKWVGEINSNPDFAKCSYSLPLAGALIAVIPAVMLVVMNAIGVPSFVNVSLVWLSMIIVTGAIHEDGLADCVDGFWGGRNQNDKIRIMKDSRIGIYGTIALIFSIGLRIAMLKYVIDYQGAIAATVVVIGIAGMSRAAMIWPWVKLKIANEHNDTENKEGSSAEKMGKPDEDEIGKTIIACIPLVVMLVIVSGVVAPVMAIVGGVLALAGVTHLFEYHIGGVRGDCLGATQQCCEICMYIGLVAFL